MPIHFTEKQWANVREVYGRWWAGTLERPLMKVVVPGVHSPGREKSKAPRLSQANVHDLSWSPEELIDALDYELCQNEYLGDSFPFVNFNFFGPGVLAAFCGARLDNRSGGVWFFPQEKLPIEDISVRYDPENQWVQRVKDIYRAGQARWGGGVLMSMPDLSGILDVAAVFRGSEDLLMDLYDEPEEVHRLCREVQQAWWDAYHDLSSVLFPQSPGYSDWSGLYSAAPSYILQSDFTYMVGPDMFRAFALPYIREDCRALANSIYHLDGVGELPHLDSLLQIPELNAVQWVYGDGQPSARHWPEVYQKIAAAGKRIYMVGDAEDLAVISQSIPRGLYMDYQMNDLAAARALLARYSVEPIID